MALETEIKLRIPDAYIIDRLTEDSLVTSYLKDPFADIRMRSSYFDTPKGDLQERKWALRLRLENSRPIVTLKTPNQASRDDNVFVRDEWQCYAQSVQEAVEPLIDLGAPAELRELAQQGGFAEQFQVNFIRKSAVLYLPDGVRIHMGVDSGEVVAGEKTEPMMELELELVFGSEQNLTSLAQRLMKKYALEKELISKYERALRLIRRRR